MTRRGALSVVAALLLCGCGEGEEPAPPEESATFEVRDLDLPTAEQREMDEKLREAQRRIAAGDEGEAEPLLERVLAIDPQNAEALGLMGEVLLTTQRRAAAIEILRKAAEFDPGNLRAHELLSRSLFELGRLAEARDAHEGWARAAPRDAEALFGLGQVLYALGELDASLEALRQAEQLRRSRADIRSELGLVLHAQGKLDKAEEKQRDALERDPAFAKAWFRLGVVICDRPDAATRYDEAAEAFRKAVKVDPQLVHAHLYLYRLERLLVERGDPDAAKRADRSFEAVLAYHEQEQLARFGMGHRRPKLVGEGEARRLKRALKDAQDDPASHLAYGRLLHARGQVADALDHYGAALERRPDDVECLALAGAAYLSVGEREAAEPLLRKALELDPEDVTSRRNLAWLLLRTDRAADAAAAFDEVLVQENGDLRALKGRGLAWMRMGKVDYGLHQISAAGWIER